MGDMIKGVEVYCCVCIVSVALVAGLIMEDNNEKERLPQGFLTI